MVKGRVSMATLWMPVAAGLVLHGPTLARAALQGANPGGDNAKQVAPIAGTGLDTLRWLAGRWQGRVDDTVTEETWSQPVGDNMTGMFRMIKGNSLRFYELMSLEKGAGGTFLLIRHFGPGLVAWEEKDQPLRYRLAGEAKGTASFENVGTDPVRRIEYRQEADGSLTIRLEDTREGKPSTQEFRFVRAP